MSAKPNRNSAGFTIVEILIVLGIASLMLLLVFDAVPALQRGSRNNQRRQDVSAILRAVSQYELNNSGDFPDCGHDAFPSCVGTGNLLGYTRLNYYSQVVVHSEPVSTPLGSADQITDINTVDVYNHQLCTNNNSEATDVAAGYSDVVALYAIENGSTQDAVCQQL